jgi:DNA-binding response OmpR family regulator
MSSASLAGCPILVCEDEPLIALDIADAFSNAGARVVTVRSLADALIAVEEEVPSAAVPKIMTRWLTRLCTCPNLRHLNSS